MFHQPSKRKQLAQRITVYSLMSTAVIVLVGVLVFFMLGYQYNGRHGRIEQGGLVQFGSRPSGAEVTIDGRSFGTRTTSKTTMAAGEHAITMRRTGYQTWQKTVSVTPGSVLWLNYARLIPLKLTPQSVTNFPAVTSTAVSPNGKYMAIKAEAATADISIVDISQKDVQPTLLTLPATSYTAPQEGQSQHFSLDSWDPSSRYLLVKHTYNEPAATEWLVVDTQRVADTKNLTTALGVAASKVVFSNDSSDKLYAQVDATVRRIDIGASTMSGPLVSGVHEFSLYKKMVLYSTLPNEETKEQSVGYYDEGAAKSRIIRSYPAVEGASLQLAVGAYFSQTYVAIARGEVVEILTGDLPRSDSDAKLTLATIRTIAVPGGVRHLSNVTNGRFIVAQSATGYVTYDLELKKVSTTPIRGATSEMRELRWLDDYMLWSDQGGMARLYEFDGANQHDIMPVVSGFNVTLSPNGSYLYGVTLDEAGVYHLSRVQMIL